MPLISPYALARRIKNSLHLRHARYLAERAIKVPNFHIRRIRYNRQIKLAQISLHRALAAPEIYFNRQSPPPVLCTLDEAAEKAPILRQEIRRNAGLPIEHDISDGIMDLDIEISYLFRHAKSLRPQFMALQSKRVLYAGQAYYNKWYLSRALRDIGWKADLMNWDLNPTSQLFYHGQDFNLLDIPNDRLLYEVLRYYVESLYAYDVFHFTNSYGICFGFTLQAYMESKLGKHSEIYLLRALGKIIAYTNNGCQDGVAQSSFAAWKPTPTCSICVCQNMPDVCSDERNLTWGKFRNSVAHYQCLLGSNRADYNRDARAHECPAVYCLDPDFWDPSLPIPEHLKLEARSKDHVWVYHAVGNRNERTRELGKNIKCSHIYQPIFEKFEAEGLPVGLIEVTGIPNRDVRFIQMQADIVVDMLTFGWFGANVREAMMLGKPVVCFLRPEWLEDIRLEIPEYVDELPIINATPETVEEVLRDLIASPWKCREIGKRSRAFAIKWHGHRNAALFFDHVYSRLLNGEALRVEHYPLVD